MPKAKGGIPEGWNDFSQCGQQMAGTPFVAFKVPLSPTFFFSQPNSDPWTLKLLKERQPNLDVVIDLTNTTKYYQPRDLQTSKLKHFKILTKGHALPDENVIRQFFKIVDDALDQNKNCVLGVHCTHGINRTGYLICRYLIQKLDWEPAAAIKEFAECRGHGIDRVPYLRDLEAARWKPQRPQRRLSREQDGVSYFSIFYLKLVFHVLIIFYWLICHLIF